MMTRLVALSVVLHGLFLVSLAYVPQLSAMMHVAGEFAGIKFVSEDYDPTLIGQRATVMRLAPHEKLYYPPDYFGAPEVAETSPFSDPTLVQQAAPPPPAPVYRPRVFRAPRPLAATPQPTPSPELAKAAPSPSPSPAASPTPDEEQRQAEAEMDKFANENDIERPQVNTKPFEDIALHGKELIDQGQLDLKNSTLDVTATAERNDDGTLKPETVKIDGLANDKNLNLLAEQVVTALSQSKVFGILKGAKNVRMDLKLDGENVSVKVASDLPTEEDAEKKATGYATLVFLARKVKKGTQEGELYNNLKFNNDGKQFIMTFEMTKDAAAKMIADMLAKKAAKEAAAAQNKS